MFVTSKNILKNILGNLKAKHEFNIASAELLIENDYFAPSVHCSYYSSLQFSKYWLSQEKKISYEDLKADMDKDNSRSTHTYIIDCVRNELLNRKGDRNEVTQIYNKFKDLKALRVEADYDNVIINDTLARKAVSFSKDICQYLKKHKK